MNSKIFSIGDIVSLKVHPYYHDLTNIIISGDHIMLSPMMVVLEVFKTKQTLLGGTGPIDTFKYKCTWFSPKQYKFIEVTAFEVDLKLIAANNLDICKVTLQRGDKITLKSSSLELGKKKSSLTYEDNTGGSGGGNTTINSLLSFLPPVMQVLDVKEHKSITPLVDKKSSTTIRQVHSWDVKFSIFDPTSDRISEYSLPLEALELVEEIDPAMFAILQTAITTAGYLTIESNKRQSIIKPRHIAIRGGYYYLRAYDYLLNKVEEFEIKRSIMVKLISTPFGEQAPAFDIAHKPESATPTFIMNEIITIVNNTAKNKSFIRIKYKNRNDQLSHRTLRNYKIITVEEGGKNVSYLVGFCLLREAERNFRTDRIQSLQELKMEFAQNIHL